jgi:nucleotide-binding universal stress UspA family protein
MKCDRILFPIDFSDHNCVLARQVAWLANRFGSRVTLLHVATAPSTCSAATEAYYDWDTYKALAERTKQRLSRFPIDLPEWRVERAVVEGEPAHEIANWANQHKAELVMIGTHDCGTFRGLLLGSAAEKMIHDVSCPVWVYSTFHRLVHEPNIAVRKIICALDLTEEAVSVLRFASDFAKRLGAQVLVVHSVPESETQTGKYIDSNIWYLQQKAGVDFPTIETGKDISRAIIDTAQDQQADLVIIGRGKCQRTLGRLRTHEYEIIRQTPCPVLSYCCTGTEEEPACSPAKHELEATLSVL